MAGAGQPPSLIAGASLKYLFSLSAVNTAKYTYGKNTHIALRQQSWQLALPKIVKHHI